MPGSFLYRPSALLLSSFGYFAYRLSDVSPVRASRTPFLLRPKRPPEKSRIDKLLSTRRFCASRSTVRGFLDCPGRTAARCQAVRLFCRSSRAQAAAVQRAAGDTDACCRRAGPRDSLPCSAALSGACKGPAARHPALLVAAIVAAVTEPGALTGGKRRSFRFSVFLAALH